MMTSSLAKSSPLPELDYRWMEREFDRVKVEVFKQKNAAFLAYVMSSLKFEWCEPIRTAGTNGTNLLWNPYYFWFLKRSGRISILVHEIWHAALLHPLRRGNRDPEVWNEAADTYLDNMMDNEGYDLTNLFPQELGFSPYAKTFINHHYDGWSVEQIYDDYMSDPLKRLRKGGGDQVLDIMQAGQAQQQKNLAIVVAAHHAAMLAKDAGKLPGELQSILKKFLKPKLPWHTLLRKFFNELASQDYSWTRPSRRSQEVYLPSLRATNPSLSHVIEYFDVSGSVTDPEVIRFNSEVKHIWETYTPEKMTIVQFDIRIQDEWELKRGEQFNELKVTGRGGTSLACVRDHIIANRPTAVIIFSDLRCPKMERLPPGLNIPIIWVAINNYSAQVDFGKLVHIREQ